jgi:septal ring factor EnvC (AmiA/AmiB activator)
MEKINSLDLYLKGFVADHKLSLPPASTPRPERNKVVSRPVRAPVNKQAALLIAPNRSWVNQPPPMPPEKLKTPADREVDRLTAELKAERNAHATTRDHLGQCRQDIRSLKESIVSLHRDVTNLKISLKWQEETIRQLEDIKL